MDGHAITIDYNGYMEPEKCPICLKISSINTSFYSSKYWLFIPLKGKNPGIGILAPKKHIVAYSELNEAQKLDFFKAKEELFELIKTKYNTSSMSISQNIGPNSGTKSKHLFYYFIPRHEDEPFVGKGLEFFHLGRENKIMSIDETQEFLTELGQFMGD